MEWKKKKRMRRELLEMKDIVIETENEWSGWNRLDISESIRELEELTGDVKMQNLWKRG